MKFESNKQASHFCSFFLGFVLIGLREGPCSTRRISGCRSTLVPAHQALLRIIVAASIDDTFRRFHGKRHTLWTRRVRCLLTNKEKRVTCAEYGHHPLPPLVTPEIVGSCLVSMNFKSGTGRVFRSKANYSHISIAYAGNWDPNNVFPFHPEEEK